jgi:hypothetical protein
MNKNAEVCATSLYSVKPNVVCASARQQVCIVFSYDCESKPELTNRSVVSLDCLSDCNGTLPQVGEVITHLQTNLKSPATYFLLELELHSQKSCDRISE